MEFVTQMMPSEPDPLAWLHRREAEGWDGVSIGDHITPLGRPYPHAWVTLGHWAAASSEVRLATAFANNLIRSPVEFAHAALSLHAASGGRFEAGLGAGWAAADVEPCGLVFPDGPARARRFREAAVVVRDLLQHRACSFHGEFYDIEVESLSVLVDDPPPLVLAVGGPWVIDNIAPLADRIEVVPFAHIFRGGDVDMAGWSAGDPDDPAVAVNRARRANPNAPINMGVFVAAGNDRAVDSWSSRLDGGALHGLAGDPERVADTLHSYAAFGVTRCTLSELVPGTYEHLAPVLV
jgi:alkanesulfonate monooxygenase SsuD/methylene tetrahydromethanopterin reductase-like flavin-dependent oxidoreductase (luciferase family)